MSDRSDGSWANHRMPSDPRSGTNVDDCEIGVWDPNSVNKSYPANNSSQYHMPSSNAWASPEQSNSNYSYGNYNNHQDYTTQLTSQAQNLSINAVSSQNSNLYYSGEPPVPQAAPYVQQRQDPMPTLTNTAPLRHENHSRRSDSTNWRNPIPSYNLPQESSSYNAPYSADAQYQQQRSQYSNQAPSQNWSSFQNPLLSGNNDGDEESPEAIVERMKQSKAAAELAAEELLRRPTTIAKSALAQLQKDLKDAAKPFESAKSLQECRNKHLGIENKSAGDDVMKAETTRKSDLPEDSAIPALVSKSNLSASAKAFVPSSPSVKLKTIHSTNSADASDQNKEAALELVGKCVYELASNPASFDHLVHDDLVPKLHNFKLDDTSITEIVDVVYEACVMEQNFRYLGGQLCHVLSRSQDGLPGFRSTLLSKAQKEFGNMDEALNGSKEEIERALGFTQFMSEIFLSLLLEKPDKSLTRMDVLGRAILGVVEKLIKHFDSDECVQCAVRVLKLTAISLEDSLKDDGKNSMAKLDAILESLANIFTNNPMEKETTLNPTTKLLLSGLLKLKDQHWGRITHEESYPPAEEPSFSSYYYPDASQYPNQAFQNEPVYFTPQGVQYTAADVFDDDFYNKHLENQNAAFDNQQQHNYSSYDDSNQYADGSSSGGLNPPNYATWSAADADYYDDNCTEDDYDNELENFLRQQ